MIRVEKSGNGAGDGEEIRCNSAGCRRSERRLTGVPVDFLNLNFYFVSTCVVSIMIIFTVGSWYIYGTFGHLLGKLTHSFLGTLRNLFLVKAENES